MRAGHLCAATMAGVVRGVDILLEFLHGELEIFEIWRKAVLPEIKSRREYIHVEIFFLHMSKIFRRRQIQNSRRQFSLRKKKEGKRIFTI